MFIETRMCIETCFRLGGWGIEIC